MERLEMLKQAMRYAREPTGVVAALLDAKYATLLNPGRPDDAVKAIGKAMEHFRRCPFCGCKGLWIKFNNHGECYPECKNCKATGPIDSLRRERQGMSVAAALWNHRFGDDKAC